MLCRYLKVLHGFTRQVIQEKRLEIAQRSTKESPAETKDEGKKKQRLAFLDLLMAVKTSDGLGGLSDSDLQEEVDTSSCLRVMTRQPVLFLGRSCC